MSSSLSKHIIPHRKRVKKTSLSVASYAQCEVVQAKKVLHKLTAHLEDYYSEVSSIKETPKVIDEI